MPLAPDYRPAYVREHFAEIEAEVRRQVAQHYAANIPLALSAADKKARLRDIDARLLASERLEAEATWAARAAGEDLPFRPTIDPRAVLGIEGPRPAKRR